MNVADNTVVRTCAAVPYKILSAAVTSSTPRDSVVAATWMNARFSKNEKPRPIARA